MLKLIFILSLLLSFISAGFAQEEIVITTYYPSPYGIYRELRSQRVAIGDSYSDNSIVCWQGACTSTIDPDADLVVEGKVGIGTVDPFANLEVNNTLRLTPNDSPNYSVEGALYYDDSENVVKYHDHTGWKNLGGVLEIASAEVRWNTKSVITPIEGNVADFRVYSSGVNWGLQCNSNLGWKRTGCALYNERDAYVAGDPPFDFDLRVVPNGCASDDEEDNNNVRAIVQIICARIN